MTKKTNAAADPDGAGTGEKKYLAHSKDKVLIPGITVGVGAFLAPRWDGENTAKGWTLTGGDLSPKWGWIFGALFYRHTDGRVARVGAKWNPAAAQMDYVALHPTEPVEAEDLTDDERDALLIDARSRLSHLMSINAQIGANVMTRSSVEAALKASGLGFLRIEGDEARK